MAKHLDDYINDVKVIFETVKNDFEEDSSHEFSLQIRALLEGSE